MDGPWKAARKHSSPPPQPWPPRKSPSRCAPPPPPANQGALPPAGAPCAPGPAPRAGRLRAGALPGARAGRSGHMGKVYHTQQGMSKGAGPISGPAIHGRAGKKHLTNQLAYANLMAGIFFGHVFITGNAIAGVAPVQGPWLAWGQGACQVFAWGGAASMGRPARDTSAFCGPGTGARPGQAKGGAGGFFKQAVGTLPCCSTGKAAPAAPPGCRYRPLQGGICMTLQEGAPGSLYTVQGTQLPLALARRLQALGMTTGCPVQVLRKKRRGAMVIKIRGSRFALGQAISSRITVKEG